MGAQDLLVGAALGHAVDADDLDGRVRQRGAHRVALAAADPVVVEHDDPAAAGDARQPFAVDVAQPGEQDQRARTPPHAPGRRAPGRCRPARHRRPRARHCPRPGCEVPVVRRLEAELPRHRDEPQVDGALRVLDRPLDAAARLGLGGGLQAGHAGHAAHQRDVADRLVRMAGAAGDDPGQEAAVDHLRALGGVVEHLLAGARRQEARERVDGGQHPAQRQRAGLRDHVLLGDPALDEALREALAERDQPAVEVQVGVERDEPRLALGGGRERLAVGGDELLRRGGRGAARRLALDRAARRRAGRRSRPAPRRTAPARARRNGTCRARCPTARSRAARRRRRRGP